MPQFFFEQFFSYDSLEVIGVAFGLLALVTCIVIIRPPGGRWTKVSFFTVFLLLISVSTVYIGGGTYYRVRISETKGPVHWHADFLIRKCGAEIDLIDPVGFSNRVGTPVIHEHGDNRIHVEGTIVRLAEASVRYFFTVIGGELTNNGFRIPTNGGTVSAQNGEQCPDGTTGELQMFVWEAKGESAAQRKIVDFPSYVMKPESLIPPGDCLILEFGPTMERTTAVCEQYEVAEKRGDLRLER